MAKGVNITNRFSYLLNYFLVSRYFITTPISIYDTLSSKHPS